MATAVTFTADAGTDQLTATAHGLLTGDRCRVRNVDGALPSPLAEVTTYFAIRVDANTLKVATSSANALAGTAVNLTDAGTGTHTLEYGLPYCEPRVATAGTQIYSADDNAAWAALTGLHALLTGQSETLWSGVVTLAGLLTANAGVTAGTNQHVTVSGTGRFKHGDMIQHVSPANGTGGGWSWDNANGYLASSGAGTWSVGIPTIVGWRVKSITFERFGDGAADLTGAVNTRAKASSSGTETTFSAVNAAASWTDEVVDIPDADIADGTSMWIYFTASAANLRIGEIRVTYAMI